MKNTGANIGSDSKSDRMWLLAISILTLLAYFVHLGVLELSGEEPRRAVVAFEMLSSGEFIVPHAYGLEYFNKPPLFNWLIALSMSVFGVSEFAVRLPGVLAYISLAFLIYSFLRKTANESMAVLAALCVITSADLLYYGTVFSGEIDLVFTFFVTANAFSLFLIFLKEDTKYFIPAYLFLTLAIFSKGLLAIPFHVLTFFALVMYFKNWKVIFSQRHLLACLIPVLFIGIYFYTYSQRGQLDLLLLNHLIESDSKIPSSVTSAVLNQFTETPLTFLKITLPWSLGLILLFNRVKRKITIKNKVVWLSALFILVNIFLYWIFVDVKERYLYPFVPFTCILVAGTLSSNNLWPQRKKWIYGIVVIMLLSRVAYNAYIIPKLDDGTLSDSYFYRELAHEIITKSNGAPVKLAVKPQSEELPVEIKGINSIEKQPYVPYQLPFYLAQLNGQTLEIERELKAGTNYLVLRNQLPQLIPNVDTVMSFYERWYGNEMFLIRLKEDAENFENKPLLAF